MFQLCLKIRKQSLCSGFLHILIVTLKIVIPVLVIRTSLFNWSIQNLYHLSFQLSVLILYRKMSFEICPFGTWLKRQNRVQILRYCNSIFASFERSDLWRIMLGFPNLQMYCVQCLGGCQGCIWVTKSGGPPSNHLAGMGDDRWYGLGPVQSSRTAPKIWTGNWCAHWLICEGLWNILSRDKRYGRGQNDQGQRPRRGAPHHSLPWGNL